jgi:ankyrin repeat protein
VVPLKNRDRAPSTTLLPHHHHPVTMSLLQLPLELLLKIAHCIVDRDNNDEDDEYDEYDEDDECDVYDEDDDFYPDDKRYLNNLKSLRQVNRLFYAYIDPIFWQKNFLLRKRASERVLARLIETNDIARLKFFLDKGADVECLGNSFAGYVELASSLDNVPIARLLLEKGAKINYGPMHAAQSAEMVHLLMDFHADPEVKTRRGVRPLHQYMDLENPAAAMRAILERGADVNPTYYMYKWTPLHKAAVQIDARRGADAVTILLEFGADVTVRDTELNTPLHLAAKEEGAEVVRLLMERWPEGVREKNSNLDTPLHRAAGIGLRSRALNRMGRLYCNTGRAEVVKFLLESWPEGVREKNKDLDTPLHLAAEAGDVESVKLLVESWPEGIKEKNKDLETPLHFAAESGESEAVRVLMERWPEGVREKNKDLDTPLHLAAETGNVHAVKLLVESWPEGIWERNENLDTPLHRAAGKGERPRAGTWVGERSAAERIETVKFLMESWPAGVREQNKNLDTPLHRAAAASNKEVVRLLAKYWPEGRKAINKKKR